MLTAVVGRPAPNEAKTRRKELASEGNQDHLFTCPSSFPPGGALEPPAILRVEGRTGTPLEARRGASSAGSALRRGRLLVRCQRWPARSLERRRQPHPGQKQRDPGEEELRAGPADQSAPRHDPVLGIGQEQERDQQD